MHATRRERVTDHLWALDNSFFPIKCLLSCANHIFWPTDLKMGDETLKWISEEYYGELCHNCNLAAL